MRGSSTRVVFIHHPTSPMWRWAWAALPAAELARRGVPARCISAEEAARGNVEAGSTLVTTLDVGLPVIRRLMDHGPVVIVVHDDIWTDDMDAIAREVGASPEAVRGGLEILSPLVASAAAVAVTSEPLLAIVEEIAFRPRSDFPDGARSGQMNPRVCHVPWAAPPECAWPPVRTRQRSGLRIGWAGLAGQREKDFALVREALTRLARERPDLVSVFWGACPSWVGGELTGRLVVLPPELLGPQAYFARLAALGLDLAIAPIAPTRLNESRSRAKFVDATVGAGCPLVASNFGPYRRLAEAGAPLVTVSDDGWYAALAALLDDAPRRDALTAAARAWVAKHATIDVVGDDWLRAIAGAAAG